MQPLHIQTPLLESRPLSKQAGCTVFIKLEAMQPSGSFKLRGIGAACAEHARRGATRFISSSGGNAGIATAYSGRRLGIPVVVVVPETTSEQAKNLIKLEDAQVIVHGGSWQEANDLALSMVGDPDAFIHPFDDPLLWTGHSSLIDEVKQAGVKPDGVVLSVGGGGLLCGVVEGLQRNNWDDVPVFAVETVGADSFAQSVRAGNRIELAAITSIATSLGAKQVCKQALGCHREHPVHSLVVTDCKALAASKRFLTDHRILVEPACGASLAAVYETFPEIGALESVLIIVCGGCTASIEQLTQWTRELGCK